MQRLALVLFVAFVASSTFSVSVDLVFAQEDDSRDPDAIKEIIDAACAVCTTPTIAITGDGGVAFQGRGSSTVGPVDMPAGVYRITFTSADMGTVELTVLSGDCGEGFAISAVEACSENVETRFMSDGCRAVFEVTLIRQLAVHDAIPVQFTVHLENHPANARLTNDVTLTQPATFDLPGAGGTINATVNLTLPAGMELPLALVMDVPVDETVPVDLMVNVEMPRGMGENWTLTFERLE